MRWKPFRITELWAKFAFILMGWLLVPNAVYWVLDLIGAPELLLIVFNVASSYIVIWIGTRAFRAQGEAVDPPRVWWRASGRPPAGFVIGGLFLWASGVFMLAPLRGGDPVLAGIVILPIAVFYLHSSIRLVRDDAPVPPRPRKNDDLKLIDRKRRF